MTTTIKGQRPSSDIRAQLADEDRPVMLAFSRGKDSIAAWLALRDAGVKDIRPYHMDLVPGLSFVADSLAYYEEFFGQKIANIPHPSFYRWLASAVFQAPENLSAIESWQLPLPEYGDIVTMLCEDWGIDPSVTWVADGVRACDSIVRRAAIGNHGAMRESTRKASVVWDWQVAEVRSCIARHNIDLPIDYELYGRSFDGIDYRFVAPLKEHRPADYATLKSWFPLVDIDLFRHQEMGFGNG